MDSSPQTCPTWLTVPLKDWTGHLRGTGRSVWRSDSSFQRSMPSNAWSFFIADTIGRHVGIVATWFQYPLDAWSALPKAPMTHVIYWTVSWWGFPLWNPYAIGPYYCIVHRGIFGPHLCRKWSGCSIGLLLFSKYNGMALLILYTRTIIVKGCFWKKIPTLALASQACVTTLPVISKNNFLQKVCQLLNMVNFSETSVIQLAEIFRCGPFVM